MATLMAESAVNMLRLEVVSREEDGVWDDFEVEAPSERALAELIGRLRASGYEVVGLPANWPVRDWAVEVVETIAEIVEMDETSAAEERLLRSLRTVAKTDQALLLSDDLEGDAPAAVSRWEALDRAARTIDPLQVAWSGDADAIAAASRALVSTNRPPSSPKAGSRHGGAAFLLGSTPRSGVAIAVGGRPPFLGAETERVRRLVRILSPWLVRRDRAAI